MIDTDKYEGHTPAPWTVTKHSCIALSEEFADIDAGPTRIASVVLDDNYELELKNEMSANAQLIADAPLLRHALILERAEVKRLREYLKPMAQLRECLWWCYDKERFGWDIDAEAWAVIGRLLGADTDHNDNEWGEEE